MAAFAGFITFIIVVGIAVFYLWAYGTIIKGATGQSKAMVLLMLIPIVNIIMPIVWGFQAHSQLLDEESEPTERKMSA